MRYTLADKTDSAKSCITFPLHFVREFTCEKRYICMSRIFFLLTTETTHYVRLPKDHLCSFSWDSFYLVCVIFHINAITFDGAGIFQGILKKTSFFMLCLLLQNLLPYDGEGTNNLNFSIPKLYNILRNINIRSQIDSTCLCSHGSFIVIPTHCHL